MNTAPSHGSPIPRDPPQVLFLGSWDWANLCNIAARALNHAVGVPVAHVYTLNPHPYGFAEEWVGEAGLEALLTFAPEAHWIITTGDGDYRSFLDLMKRLPLRDDVRLGVTHCGSAYRARPAHFNALDQQMGASLRFVGQDLLRLCPVDPRAVPMLGCHDTIEVHAPTPIESPVRIAHSPSVRAKKGTDTILRVLERLERSGGVEVDLIEGVGFEECLRRRSQAHVFIDQLAPDIGGWGQSSIEAMAQGCAVVCDFHNVVDAVYGFYDRPPLLQVNDAPGLERTLRDLLEDRERLQAFRQASVAWSLRWSSRETVGRYWLWHLEAKRGP